MRYYLSKTSSEIQLITCNNIRTLYIYVSKVVGLPDNFAKPKGGREHKVWVNTIFDDINLC